MYKTMFLARSERQDGFRFANVGILAERLKEDKAASVDYCGDAGGEGPEGKGELRIRRDGIQRQRAAKR